MSKDKKVLYTISVVMFAVLFALLFIDFISSAIFTAILIVPFAVVTLLLVKKRSSVSIKKREALLLISVVSVLYVIVKELTGIYFGFYKNPYFVNSQIFFKTVLPFAIIIVATEIIRRVLISQKERFVSILAFLSCVIAEVLMFWNIVNITSFNRFMDLVGMTLFSAICANVYYHYVSKNFGAVPNIVYRLVTTLYIYFIPNISAMSDALVACTKVLVPIGLLSFVSSLYEKKKREANQRKLHKLTAVFTVISVAAILSVAMLISCQFRFGALVIATDSMTGEINKGDVIIYERYDDQPIKEGQVIVFNSNSSKIIHRVIKIEHIGNEVRYYTKGDANEVEDKGYITDKDIVGLTDMKVAYAGYPTLWLREMLESKN